MPQNWWDAFPEVMPSPAARPYPLPGPGGIMPGGVMGLGPDPLSGAPRLGQAPNGGFDPSFLSGAPMVSQVPSSSPGQAPPIGYPQLLLPGDQAGPLSDRRLEVQQAAAAIRDGADPRAVRARLQQIGSSNPVVDPSDSFSDLVPGARQRMIEQFGAPPMQAQPVFEDQARFGALAEDGSDPESQPGMPSHALDPGSASQKAGDPLKSVQQKGGVGDRDSAPLSTYGLPSFPGDDQSMTANLRGPAGALNRGVRWGAQQTGIPTKPEPEHPNARARLRMANEAELNDPRVLAFLDTIAAAEGSDYHSLYGDNLYGVRRTFDDMLKHPGNVGRTRNGVPQSAAGRYQILRRPTYDNLLQRMGSLDMSPRSQDIMAVDLLRTSRALDALRANDFDTAVSNSSGPWASLPHRVGRVWQGSRYPNQTARSIEALRAAYNRALQYYSAPGPVPANNRPPLQIRLP